MPDDLRISLEELRRRMDRSESFIFLDSRNPQAWAESDVKLPRAIRVPVDEFASSLSEIPKDKPIVTYCT